MTDSFASHASNTRDTDGVGPVLVVEDHADTRHMVETFLSLHGIRVVGADNGLTGLAALRTHRPSVVLLDLSMPVMDGWGFRAEQQRISDKQLAGVPVVIMSALNDCERHAEELTAAAVIPKPIDFDRLLAVVQFYHGPVVEIVRGASRERMKTPSPTLHAAAV